MSTAQNHHAAEPAVNGEDIVALRRDFYVPLEQGDDQLMRALAGHDDLVHLARRWDWSDTEVRDRAAPVFEAAFGIDLP